MIEGGCEGHFGWEVMIEFCYCFSFVCFDFGCEMMGLVVEVNVREGWEDVRWMEMEIVELITEARHDWIDARH